MQVLRREMTTQLLTPGSVLDDRYKIIHVAAQGGMGIVYFAEEVVFHRKVAVKVLHPELHNEADDQARFQREGKILATLGHPNVVKFFRFGFILNKLPYLVMEWLDGRSLRMLIDEGELSRVNVLTISIQVCDALSAVHEAGIVHRDLKPGNIMVLNEGGKVKLVDFGLSRVLSQSVINAQGITKTGVLIGSVQYMAPEQAMGEKVDCRADIYSLGCIMYEMLIGERPFHADDPVGLLAKHVNERERNVDEVGTAIPRGFSSVIAKSMAKDPGERYQTAAELRSDLEKVLAGRKRAAAANIGESVSEVAHSTTLEIAAITVVVLLVASITVLSLLKH